MEIAHLRWLERSPTRHGLDEEVLNYKLQLLVDNRFVAITSGALAQVACAAQEQPARALRFVVPGSFNGRLFDCSLTVSAGEVRQAGWLASFEQKLRALCRAQSRTQAATPA